MTLETVTFQTNSSSCKKSWFVKSSSREYEIVLFDSRFSPDLINEYDAILVDDHFQTMIPFLEKVLFLKVSEQQKSFESYQQILDFFLKLKLHKSSKVLVIGGGLMHDICGFAVSTYARGIRWSFIPTTLVAMVDVCVGGKCAINYRHIKNILGTIYPPYQVFIFSDFAKTLTLSNISSGLIEAIKTAFIGNRLNQFNKYIKIGQSNIEIQLNEIIPLSLKIKSNIVEIDEFDHGIRQNLNVGHTIGHAIESATCHQIEHGLAVGVGILAKLKLYEKIQPEMEEDVFILKHLITELLSLNKNSLQPLKNLDYEIFEKALMMDKKNKDGKVAFAFPCLPYVPSKSYPDFEMRTYIQYVELSQLSFLREFLKDLV